MKKPNITPGPWRILDDYHASFHNEFTPRIEDVWEIGNREEGSTPAYATSEANGKAIAAVPDLLAALEQCLPDWHADDNGTLANGRSAGEISVGDMRAIKAALTKAGYTF